MSHSYKEWDLYLGRCFVSFVVLLKLLFLFVSHSPVSGQCDIVLKLFIFIFDGASDVDPN